MFACAHNRKTKSVIVGTHGSSRTAEIGAVTRVASVNPLSMLSTTSMDNQKPTNKLELTRVKQNTK